MPYAHTTLSAPVNAPQRKPHRRDILLLATGAVAGVAVAGVAWPFVASMNPDASALSAGAPLDVDLAPIAPGQMVTVRWRGAPIFVIRRTPAALEKLRAPELLSRLLDPDSDVFQQPVYTRNWSRAIDPQIGVYVAICTHLGCVPQYHPEPSTSTPTNDWFGGMFCACHGSKYDLAGRVFAGVPAPYNLPTPPYRLVDDKTLRIGENPPGEIFDMSSVVQM